MVALNIRRRFYGNLNVVQRVTFLTWLGTLTLILLGVTGVVTSPGLSDSISADGTIHAEYQHVADRSGFGHGTRQGTQNSLESVNLRFKWVILDGLMYTNLLSILTTVRF